MKKRGIIFVIVLLVLSSFVYAGTLKVTSEHPFLIDGQWIPAKELKVGDRLTEINGKIVEITSIKKVTPKEPFLVYNIEAGKYHNFVVRDTDNLSIVVHNSNEPPIDPRIKNEIFTVVGSFKQGLKPINSLREGRLLEGYVYKPIINENKQAISALAKYITEDTDLLIGTDRGGGFLAELIHVKSKTNAKLIRIPKAEGNIQHLKIEQIVDSFVSSNQKTRRIALIETAFEGGSARFMMRTAESLAKKHPSVKFDVLIHKETLGRGELTLKSDYPNINIVIEQSRFIIGEDINLDIIDPIKIFDIGPLPDKKIDLVSIGKGRARRAILLDLLARDSPLLKK